MDILRIMYLRQRMLDFVPFFVVPSVQLCDAHRIDKLETMLLAEIGYPCAKIGRRAATGRRVRTGKRVEWRRLFVLEQLRQSACRNRFFFFRRQAKIETQPAF
jgi:hypothetical protein